LYCVFFLLKLKCATRVDRQCSRECPSAITHYLEPVPLNDAVCGLFEALSVTDKVPLLLPLDPGRKVTLIVQLACEANEVPQLLVWLNADAPVVLIETMVSVVDWPLVKVTDLAELVVATD
jgi:hypothetical protein